MAISISYSKASSYLKCPKQHYLSYILRLTPKKPIRPLYFGSDLHKLLELRANPKELKKARKEIAETFYDMPAKFQSELGDNYVQDLFNIFEDYCRLYAESPLPTKTELAFELPIGKIKGEEVIFTGKIDELYKRRRKTTGKKFIRLGEHKSFSQQPDMNTLVMNTQIYLYAKAVHILEGILPEKVTWDYIKSTPAKHPIWLESSKRFSLANSKDVTSYSFERACAERGVDDPKVLAHADRYAPNLSNFFFKCELELIPGMVDEMWESFMYTCKQIVLYGEKNKIKNVTRDCKWCSYRDICYAEFTGGDVDYVIAKDFKEKEKRNG